MEARIKAGLIGYGTGGQFFHAPFLYAMPEYQFYAVVERSVKSVHEKFNNVLSVPSVEALCALPELELIVITTPNHTHFEIAKQALLAGKHVVVDKPFTVLSEEATELIAIAKKMRLVLAVYHNRRFHSDFATVEKLLQEKSVGELLEFEACFDRYRPELRPNAWKEKEVEGAGILYDLGSHLIDQTLVLFGRPLSIQASLKKERPGALVIDFFEVVFRYPTHKALLKAGMLVKSPGPIFKLTGSKGEYTKFGLDPQEGLLREGVLPKETRWALESKEHWGVLEVGAEKVAIEPIYRDYTSFYRNVFNAIRKGESLVVSPEAGRLVIQCIEAAIESSVENKPIAIQ